MATKKQKEDMARMDAAIEAAKKEVHAAIQRVRDAEALLSSARVAVRHANTARARFDAQCALGRLPQDLRDALRGTPTRDQWKALARRRLAMRNRDRWSRGPAFYLTGIGRGVVDLLNEEGEA